MRVGLGKLVCLLLLLSVFLGLGFWQLERAREKTGIRDSFLSRAEQSVVTVGTEPLDVEAMAYRRATAAGRFVPEFGILLDNKVYQGQAGFHVLTPLRPHDGTMLLLVNRGWMPWGVDRQQIPEIDVPEGPVEVSGRLARPARHAISFEADTGDAAYQPVWQNLDLARYSRMTGYPVHGLVLQAAPDGLVGGMVRDWPEYSDSWIQRHKGYAFQWFALAVTLLVIFIVVNIKRKNS